MARGHAYKVAGFVPSRFSDELVPEHSLEWEMKKYLKQSLNRLLDRMMTKRITNTKLADLPETEDGCVGCPMPNCPHMAKS